MEQEQSEWAILLVDDEAQTLKYFRRAFEREFRILTATSADGGIEILKEEADRIAVLVSDQRMPDKRGVELLKYARSEHPEIVRILTTGYTDLEDAIDAVNDGEIHRYITKPWDLNALQLELRQSMKFFLLRRERDDLLREKMSVKQRLEGVNRVRELVAAASGFTATRNPLKAVRMFLEQIPIAGPQENRPEQAGWGRQMENIEQLATGLSQLAGTLASKRGEPASTLRLGSLVEDALRSSGVEATKVDAGNLGADSVEGNAALLGWAFDSILAWLSRAAPSEKIVINGKTVGNGVEIQFSVRGGTWSDVSLVRFPPSVLGAYLVFSHHFGSLAIGPQEDGNFLVHATLPESKEEQGDEPLEFDWLERVLRRFENW